MVKTKEWLFSFDEKFHESLKLGGDSKIQVMGRGNLKLHMNGITQVITNLCYFPGLKNNILSIGQLMKKELTIMFKDEGCKIHHANRVLVMSTNISSNITFVMYAPIVIPGCMKISSNNVTHLWHYRYGHLSYKGLDVLIKKETVKGMPSLKDLDETFIS